MATTVQMFSTLCHTMSLIHTPNIWDLLCSKQCRLISVVPESRDKRKSFKLLESYCFNIKKRCLIFISLFMFFKTLAPYILLEKHCIIEYSFRKSQCL